MAKKKVIQKKVKEEVLEEEVKEVKVEKAVKKAGKKSKAAKTEAPEEDIDAFDLEEVPETDEEASEIEKEMAGEEAFDEEIEEERFYWIPLAKNGYMKTPYWKRSKKAVKVIREFLERHMKPEGDVYISQDLNERIWENGIRHPPRKVRVRATKSVDGIVRAYLA